MVSVRYEVSRADFLAVERLRVPAWRRWASWAVFGVLGAICFGIGAISFTAQPPARPGGWWIVPAIFIAAFAATRVERWWLRERAWRRTRAMGEVVAEISDAGVWVKAGPERTFTEWRAFTHYGETPELFLLYQGKSQFRYMPEAALQGSSVALSELHRLLDTHVRLTRYDNRQVQAGFPVKPA